MVMQVMRFRESCRGRSAPRRAPARVRRPRRRRRARPPARGRARGVRDRARSTPRSTSSSYASSGSGRLSARSRAVADLLVGAGLGTLPWTPAARKAPACPRLPSSLARSVSRSPDFRSLRSAGTLLACTAISVRHRAGTRSRCLPVNRSPGVLRPGCRPSHVAYHRVREGLGQIKRIKAGIPIFQRE